MKTIFISLFLTVGFFVNAEVRCDVFINQDKTVTVDDDCPLSEQDLKKLSYNIQNLNVKNDLGLPTIPTMNLKAGNIRGWPTIPTMNLKPMNIQVKNLPDVQFTEDAIKRTEAMFHFFATLIGKGGEWQPDDVTFTVGEVVEFIAEISGLNFTIELLGFSPIKFIKESEHSKEYSKIIATERGS